MLTKWKRFWGLTPMNLLMIAAGTAMIALAILQIHDPAAITEGGILGLSLLLKNVFGIKPMFTAPLLDFAAYVLAFKCIGSCFLKTSIAASGFYTFFLYVFGKLDPLLPNLYESPLLAALLGGLAIGIGASLVMMQGGASGGDDALAMVLAQKGKIKISHIFLFMDFVVLGLSLTYIPFTRLFWSFLTTFISSVVIGQFEPFFKRQSRRNDEAKDFHSSPVDANFSV